MISEENRVAASTAHPTLSGKKIISMLKECGIEFVISVPDITTSEALLRPLAVDRDLKLIRVCKEDEAVGVSAALAACGKRSLTLVQNTGLLYSTNALRVIVGEYRQPVLMMVGLLQKEEGVAPRDSARFGVKIIEPLLDLLRMRHRVLDSDGDLKGMREDIDRCYEHREALAFLVGRSPA